MRHIVATTFALPAMASAQSAAPVLAGGLALDAFIMDFTAVHEDCKGSCALSVCETKPDSWKPDGCVHATAPKLDRMFDEMRVLDIVEYVNETFRTCPVVPSSKPVQYQCEMGTKTALQVLASALHLMSRCYVPDGPSNFTVLPEMDADFCMNGLHSTYFGVINLVRGLADKMAHGPQEAMAPRLRKIADELEHEMRTESTVVHLLGMMWGHISEVARKIIDLIRWDIWRNNHWVWLTENLHGNGTIQELGWGAVGRNGDDDAYDPTKHTIDTNFPPLYNMAEPEGAGMRWDIVKMLLREVTDEKRILLGLRPEDPDPVIIVVEIGVFAGHFSDFLLRSTPNLRLIGIDPYIGSDGTFPGSYSKNMHPDEALAMAWNVYQQYGEERATLLPTTGIESAPLVQDGSVDLIFADGCHYYECIKEDIEVWEPKLRPGGFFTGHDFSPQWPGVVRAVHEARGGKSVTLGMDWMYWWKIAYQIVENDDESAPAAMEL